MDKRWCLWSFPRPAQARRRFGLGRPGPAGLETGQVRERGEKRGKRFLCEALEKSANACLMFLKAVPYCQCLLCQAIIGTLTLRDGLQKIPSLGCRRRREEEEETSAGADKRYQMPNLVSIPFCHCVAPVVRHRVLSSPVSSSVNGDPE